MHKLFLSDSECSFIQGSDGIIRCLGGFPSMENCNIVNISINYQENSRFNVVIIYDISEWNNVMNFWRSEKTYKIDTKNRKIKLLFSNCRDIRCVPDGKQASDIYFANIDPTNSNGNCYPSKQFISDDDIPFYHDADQACVFYDRYNTIIINFFANEATVSAVMI